MISNPADTRPPLPPEAHCARRWLLLAVAVLIIAGLFALALVVARMPPFDRLVTDPLFFRRALVVHVDLSLVAWFYSFVAAMLFALPGRGQSGRLSRRAIGLSGAGITLMVIVPALGDGAPVLSNYIPMIDHPLFGVGLLMFGGGVIASLLDRRLLPGDRLPGSDDSGAGTPAADTPAAGGFLDIPADARPGLRAAAVALIVAAITMLASWLTRPVGASPEVFYELLFWGTGHVLQVTSEIAMISVWLILLGAALGRPVVSRSAASALFGLLLAPWLISPLLALSGTTTALYRVGFTRLMQWAIFPVVLVFSALCLRALAAARREGRLPEQPWRDPRILGFAVSLALTLLGFILGASIRGSNTIVPAHYHASIGAVTAAFMAMTYLLLEPLGMRAPRGRMRRIAALQPVVFGVGQMVFASGFALAGAFGTARKAYGAEQASRGLGETIGLGVMGVGGLIAAAGGVAFLVIVFTSWLQTATKTHPAWRTPWDLLTPPPRIRSRS